MLAEGEMSVIYIYLLMFQRAACTNVCMISWLLKSSFKNFSKRLMSMRINETVTVAIIEEEQLKKVSGGTFVRYKRRYNELLDR